MSEHRRSGAPVIPIGDVRLGLLRQKLLKPGHRPGFADQPDTVRRIRRAFDLEVCVLSVGVSLECLGQGAQQATML